MALRRSSAVEESVDFVFHVFAHFDLRRPGALEAFARQFLRRVNAEFAPLAISLVAWSSTSVRIEIIHFPALPEWRVCVGSQSENPHWPMRPPGLTRGVIAGDALSSVQPRNADETVMA